jgi:cold-inducible RNA-binding protein
MQNRLYVGNLAGDVAASTLQELFEPHGYVMDVKLVPDEKRGSAPGFALVMMANDASANAAINALNGSTLHGLLITVQIAQDKGTIPQIGSKGEL